MMAVTKKFWSRRSGQTFESRAPPIPTEATAFLIEDISAQVTQTRSFQGPNWKQGQAMLDTLDDAIGVFLNPRGF